jgi:hypothetical protein
MRRHVPHLQHAAARQHLALRRESVPLDAVLLSDLREAGQFVLGRWGLDGQAPAAPQ